MPERNTVSSLNEGILQEIQHYGPVTALRIHGRNIFVGYGPLFKMFHIDELDNKVTLIRNQRVFQRNKIHCIAIINGNRVALAGGRSFAVVDLDSSDIHEKSINEWIVACEFLDDTHLLILTSHNEVLKIDFSNKFCLDDKIHCNEKSILYSGSICLTDTGKIYIAAGTVMSGVIIWDLDTRQIVHVLTAHEGSIFGVKISQDLKYIISCSDDRSVKLCDFESGSVLASGWGHGSRIWSLDFVTTVQDVTIFSTGEDCTARMWKYEGSDTLKQIELWDHCHLGKHIWSGDVNNALAVAATGGADGKVRVHDISTLEDEVSVYTSQNIAELTGQQFNAKEIIKHFVDLNGLIVVITSMGNVFTFQRETNIWTPIIVSEEDTAIIRSSAMLRAFPAINSVAIFTRLGHIMAISFNVTGQFNKINWIKEESESKKIINVLVTEGNDKNEYWALLDSPNPNVPLDIKRLAYHSDGIVVVDSHQLDKPDPRVFTPTSIHFDPTNNWLLVGSRHANFAIYNLASENYHLPQLIRKISPGDTLTSVSTVQSSDNNLIALITVRDGTYLYLSISIVADEFKVEIILQNKLSRGTLEGGFVSNNDLFVYGFRSSSFSLWNETKQIEIGHHLCGGAHRQWEFNGNDSEFSFVYSSKSGLVAKEFHSRFSSSNGGLLVGGTHGREIRSVSLSPVQELDGTRLIATASEDAAVRLGKIDSNGNIDYLWTLNNHVSGLQAIAFVNSDYIISSAANEELLIWKLHRISDGVVTMVEHSRLQTSEENPDLRIMDFASIEDEGGFWVAAVYSNSQIRVFFYNKDTRSFSLSIEDTYSTLCVLHVNFITSNEKKYLVISTTDGFLTIWEITSSLSIGKVEKLDKLVVLQQIHQSGVKALAIIPGVNEWDIVTGGDDNALILSKLIATADTVSLQIISFIEYAASATITGLRNVGDNQIFVTSVDQIVRLWDFSDNSLKLKSANYTTVADTGCCDVTVFGGRHFGLVGGAGLGFWEINQS